LQNFLFSQKGLRLNVVLKPLKTEIKVFVIRS